MATITPLKRKPRLRIVGEELDYSYEYEQRNHILSRDWSNVHTLADRRSPFATIVGRLR